jgi:peptidoglycan/LPS O-acetylase OafA/YrhL
MRNKSLDVLRAVAVLLVLGRHAYWPVDYWLTSAWKRGGWVGVDLFFVLSGFLVSGLLFSDYEHHGIIRWRRFYLRRGFKIYPAFWVMILFTVCYMGWKQLPDFKFHNVLGELLFLQNYDGHLWGHTWSLAVEEHFYFLLPPLLIYLPHKKLPRLVFATMGCLLLARCLVPTQPFKIMAHVGPTHLRLDSLLFGVLLCYWHRHWPAYKIFCARHAGLLYGLGVVLLLPAFIWPIETPFIYTVGFSLFFLGGGAILSAAVCRGLPGGILLAKIGVYSYSIYLWHAAVIEILVPRLGLEQASWTGTIVFFLGSILIGIGFSKAIEMPCLKLRERLTFGAGKDVEQGLKCFPS